MKGKGPVDPADLPDTPWRGPAIVQPGVAVAPLAVPVRPAAGGGLSLDSHLDAALHDDHTEDTPPTAVPGHFGYTSEALLARMMEDDEDDPEETALRAPLKRLSDVAPAQAPVADAAPPAAAVTEAAPVAAVRVAPAAQASVQVPLWVVAATFLLIGLLAGAVLTMFIMGL